VGTPSVVAEGLKPCEDFIDGHADDYTRNKLALCRISCT
jgi:hypothetical protein